MTEPGKPDLVVPDRRIVSIEEARALMEEKQRDKRHAGSQFDAVTRKEMVAILGKIGDGISDASLAMGNKVYDQLAEESGQYLREMEMSLRQEIANEFYQRSLRGRLHTLWSRVRQSLSERGWLSPLGPVEVHVVDPVEALDPNVEREFHDHYDAVQP